MFTTIGYNISPGHVSSVFTGSLVPSTVQFYENFKTLTLENHLLKATLKEHPRLTKVALSSTCLAKDFPTSKIKIKRISMTEGQHLGHTMEMHSQIMVRFLRCHICSETLVDPVSLRCNHSFCQNCITQYWNQGNCRDCAVCKKEFPKDSPGINISMKELADTFAGRLQIEKSKIKTREAVCSCKNVDKKPTWFCLDEGITWCEQCQHPLAHAGHKLKRVKEAVETVRVRAILESPWLYLVIQEI